MTPDEYMKQAMFFKDRNKETFPLGYTPADVMMIASERFNQKIETSEAEGIWDLLKHDIVSSMIEAGNKVIRKKLAKIYNLEV